MNNSGASIFNTVRSYSSQAFQDVVPEATNDNIAQLGNILMNQEYQAYQNEFVSNLINRIAYTMISNKGRYNNPLEMFKKGSIPLGTDIQDLYTNPAEAQQYEISNKQMARILAIMDPDTHVAYYRRNRQDYYQVTIKQEDLAGAFISWDKFTEYLNSLVNTLYSGNYIDEFEYTKNVIDSAYDNNKVIMEEVSALNSAANVKAFVKKIKSLYRKLTFPSTEYNAYSKFSGAKGKIKTWSTKDRICLIIPSDVEVEIDLEVLAPAFNMTKAELEARTYLVDSFSNSAILGIICDESWLQIYDNLLRMEQTYNGGALATNVFLHAWNTYAISPFANAVMLVTEKPVVATDISLSSSSLEVEIDDTTTVTASLTPNNATSEVNFYSSNPNIFTVTQNNLTATLTGKSAGSATLFVKTDNGLKLDATVTVVEPEVIDNDNET